MAAQRSDRLATHYKETALFCRRTYERSATNNWTTRRDPCGRVFEAPGIYGIIARNWRCSLGELDLIALDESTLVFVEVRTRRSFVTGLAEESVTLAKRRRLSTLAAAYLQHRVDAADPWLGPWRIDVVAVQIGADGLMRLRHLQHAVEEC